MTKPYVFQLKAVRQIEKWHGRALLAMEMGTGKTLASLLYAHRHPELRPIVVVCPASIKYQWQREASKHFGMVSEVLEGRKQPKEFVKSNHPITIVNYDILKDRLSYLLSLQPQLIILDESSAIANRSQRTRATRNLCKGVPHVVALSGTPLVNRPAELWNTLNILRPDLFPSFFSFCQKFANAKLKPWGWDFSGASNLDKLHYLLTKNVGFRLRKIDVLKELPQKQHTIVPMELSDRSEYEKALNDFLAWIREHHAARISAAEKAQRLVQLGYLKRLAGLLKLPSVFNWVDNFLKGSEEKLILFAHHLDVVEQLRQRYSKTCVVVNGSVTGKKRQEAFDQFINGKPRLFIGNIRAAGTGWSAKGCSNIAFVELDFVPGMHSQCCDRSHGIGRGQKGVSTSIWWLIAQDTIEERLLEIIQSKQEVISAVLDGESREDDLNVYDLLVKSLTKGKK